ncbi:MAG: carbon storage regulator CsrA [Tissierellaceae bacterium]|nr:carbon storage regulator CsrA [Tissierellaceae bacterium]
MLILTRKKGEAIIVNGNIEIRVIELEDGRVKIGIEAPKDIDIIRKELYEKVEEENIAAVKHRHKLEDMKRLLEKDK